LAVRRDNKTFSEIQSECGFLEFELIKNLKIRNAWKLPNSRLKDYSDPNLKK
jgi:hypothetical protein